MAFKMKGFPLREAEPTLPEGAEGTNVIGEAKVYSKTNPLNPKQESRLAFLRKGINNSGISEKKYQSMKAEIRAMELQTAQNREDSNI